ncbi:phage holin family protein [Yersinia massiliensis]|uniref:phage holin family protein n=1 Tax=Yersinia massiliensis TaxID=419257 RepID=UPI001CFE65E6|nr:phage holin family protein [Yersinia massiliensis]MCB5308356.1 phage holin family protein [Yersinia massiliensis]
MRWIGGMMDGLYSKLTYGGAGVTSLFAALSLQDWGFIIGVVAGVIFTGLTYRLNRREQTKRTRILQQIADKVDSQNPSAAARVISDVVSKVGVS